RKYLHIIPKRNQEPLSPLHFLPPPHHGESESVRLADSDNEARAANRSRISQLSSSPSHVSWEISGLALLAIAAVWNGHGTLLLGRPQRRRRWRHASAAAEEPKDREREGSVHRAPRGPAEPAAKRPRQLPPVGPARAAQGRAPRRCHGEHRPHAAVGARPR